VPSLQGEPSAPHELVVPEEPEELATVEVDGTPQTR
jgi:hypothetical protein